MLLGKEPTQQSSVSDDSIANDTTVKLIMQLDPFDKAEIRGMARQMLTAPKYQEEDDDGYYIGRVAGFGNLPQEIKVPKENHDEIIRLTEKIIAEQNKKDMKQLIPLPDTFFIISGLSILHTALPTMLKPY